MAGVRLVEDVVSISGVQIVHRVDAILVPGARGDQRPVVVLAGADATKRTILVATRSGVERSGASFPDRRNRGSGTLDGSQAGRTSCASFGRLAEQRRPGALATRASRAGTRGSCDRA